MAREQPSAGDLLPLLETSDLRQLEEIKGLINEHLSTERGSMLLNGLVDYFLETSSSQAMHILSSVREPHDKHLLEKMNESMNRPACRLPTLTLLGHVVRKQPSWIHKIARYPLLLSLLKCLKTDSDVVVLITGLLVLVTLLPTIPQAGKQHLYEFFDIFGRLASWNLKNPGHISEVYLIHLHASVYSLFHRLYGMYPCNFVSYLRSHYSMKENLETFEEVVKPMLEHVRIHPELVTGTKDQELDPTRWKRFEIHDIVIECAKVSLDPKEASCEEGYVTMPDSFYPHLQLRPQDSTSSPYTDFYSSYGSSSSTPRQPLAPPISLPPFSGSQASYRSPQISRHQNSSCELSSACGGKDPLWSPSSLCGMATPPSSRGMSPNAELSQSASHLPGRLNSTSGGKGTPASSTPAPSSPPPSSPPPSLSEDLSISLLTSSTSSPPQKEGGAVESKPNLVRQQQVREQVGGEGGEGGEAVLSAETVSMTLTELSVFMKEQELQEKEREEASITEELLKITEEQREQTDQTSRHSVDSPFYRTTETLTGPREKPRPHPSLGGPPRDPHRALSTPGEGAVGGGGGDSRMSSQEQPWVFQPVVFTPIERLGQRSPPALEDEGAKYQLLSPSPCMNPSLPYEALFDLALPRAAPLFVGRRTAEARARLEARGEGGEAVGGEEDGETSASPLEVLDRLVQQGSDTHHKVLKRLPLPSKSADWTHFGGSVPLDELHTQHIHLQLLHGQLLYERYKREQHAVRNRRLLRRIINATALEEQNNAMKAQLSLQAVDMLSLRESLLVEQQRSRQLREEKEALVSCLQAQVHSLQLGRDAFCTRNQELQSQVQEYQKRLGELEAELQKANNKVCQTGHLLQQMTVKLSSSESTQQQMSFLNKQLLLLGEAHKLCIQELSHTDPDTSKETQMVRASWGQEVVGLRQSLVQQGQRLEAAQHRVGELEALLAKKEHLITEQKKFLEDVKGQARAELQASDSRYKAQRRVTLLLQTELLQLYSRLEMERPACTSSSPPAGGAEQHTGPPSQTSFTATDGPMRAYLFPDDFPDNKPPPSPRGNGSTLSPGQPKAKAPETTNSVNGNQDSPPPPLLVEPPPSSSSPPDPAPLTVGSYPSAKSFLGMRARELFRNKSESQCDEDSALPAPRLAGLAHCLKTELCVEPPPAADPLGPRQVSTPPKEALAEHRQKPGGPGSPRRKMGGLGGPVRAGGGVGVGLGRVGGMGPGPGKGGGGLGAGPARAGGAGANTTRSRQQQLRIIDYNETHHDHS